MTIFALLAAALVSPVRAADFPISHFGAKTGGEKCTAAFAAAFAAAGMSGGGRGKERVRYAEQNSAELAE